MVEVSGLINPEMLVEIEAEAIVNERGEEPVEGNQSLGEKGFSAPSPLGNDRRDC